MRRTEARVEHLERVISTDNRGCATCRYWGRSGVYDDFGYVQPPPACSDCGRETPPIHRWIHVAGVHLDRD
jgi:hypothetical protein